MPLISISATEPPAVISKRALAGLRDYGVVKIESVIPPETLSDLVSDLYDSYEFVMGHVGPDSLREAGESGVVRAPLVSSENFMRLAARPDVLGIIEAVVGEASILHLQNGFILEPMVEQEIDSRTLFQGTWHRDFPRYTGDVPLGVNAFYVLSDFTLETGATEFVLGSHLSGSSLSSHLESLECVVAEASPGDLVLFDSTIWHRAGTNRSRAARLAVNHQYTFSWMKQQLDLPRLLGADRVSGLSARQQQLVGFFTRVPGAYDEFYVPQSERFYRGGQG